MDNELRREFRAFKTEVEDRLNRLEDAVKAINDKAAPASPSKKGADSAAE